MTMLPAKPENGQATEEHAAEVEAQQVKVEEQEQEFEDVTQARLEAVMQGEGVPEPEPEPAEKSDDQDDSTPEKKEPAEEPDKEDKSTPEPEPEKAEEGEKGKEGEQKDIPQLSDAYYRAAVHRGWKEEDIKDFYESTPELCVKTLGNIYEALNRSSKEFATLGRIHKEQTARVAQEAAQPKPAVTEAVIPEFKGIDFKALENSDLDETTITALKATNEQNKMIFETLQKTVPAQETVQPSSFTPQQVQTVNREAAQLEQQIEGFFNNSIKGYEDYYGVVSKGDVDWEKLSPGQRMNRWTTIQMMDELMAGSVAYGREITVDEALQRAHLSTSESEREKVIREELTSKLTKRSKSLTLKPSGSAKTEGSKPTTDADLLDATQQRLNKIFG